MEYRKITHMKLNDLRFDGPTGICAEIEFKDSEPTALELLADYQPVSRIPIPADGESSGRSVRKIHATIPAAVLEKGAVLIHLRVEGTGQLLNERPLLTGCTREPVYDAPWPPQPSLLPARRVCIVAPHPDDEGLIFGGAAVLHKRRGAEVHILCLTDGGAIAPIRREESIAAGKALGADEVTFLDLPDGKLNKMEMEAVRLVSEYFRKCLPDLIYVPSPLDWHSDHEAAARIVSLAATATGIPQVIAFGELYQSFRPNLVVDISDVWEQKSRACEAYASQTTVHSYQAAIGGLNAYRGLQALGREGRMEAYCAVPVQKGVSPVDTFLRIQGRGFEGWDLSWAPPSSDESVSAQETVNLPELDVSMLVYHSEKELLPCFESLLKQNYPTSKMHVYVRDHSSDDDCWITLQAIHRRWRDRFATLHIERGRNVGFGAGHNSNFRHGNRRLLLCSNVDLTFEPEGIVRAVETAMQADAKDAAWEFRQRPYEHPKIYDPVTLAADWCSAACLLLRREAYDAIGGFDETLFLYGEDVDLSYRLRVAGWRLRYCPSATVLHRADDSPETAVRPQHRHLHYGDFLVRLRFGNRVDRRHGLTSLRRGIQLASHFKIPLLTRAREWVELAHKAWLMFRSRRRFRLPSRPSALRFFEEPEVVARVKALRKPGSEQSLRPRKRAQGGRFKPDIFCFHRQGAGWREPLPQDRYHPLVSIIIRTTGDRPGFLREALHSVANQTYSLVELVVVEDGGDAMRELVESFRGNFKSVIYLPISKSGRSAAGNAGLAHSNGRCLCFLDDDDLLLADHVQTLVNCLAVSPSAPAAAALAMELPTLTACPDTPVYRESGPRHQHLHAFEHSRLWTHNLFPIQTVLFRRELYHLAGGFDESLDALEDWDLWMRYSLCGAFVIVPKATSAYRVPGDPDALKARQRALDAPYEQVRAQHWERSVNLPVSLLARQTHDKGTPQRKAGLQK